MVSMKEPLFGVRGHGWGPTKRWAVMGLRHKVYVKLSGLHGLET